MKKIQEHLDIILANTDGFYCYFDETCYAFKGLEKDYLITSEIEPIFDVQIDCGSEKEIIFVYNEKSGWSVCGSIKNTTEKELSSQQKKMLNEFMLKVKPIIYKVYGYSV